MTFILPRQVILLLLCLISITQAVAFDDFDKYRPSNVNDEKWSNLKSSVQESMLLPQPTGVGGDNVKLGYSVSIDGNRAIVGAYHMDSTGVVYVLEFDGINWSKTFTLKPNVIDMQLLFGYSVSLSGNTALVGAPAFESGLGTAYFFEFDGVTWIEKQNVIALDGQPSDLFGRAVSLSMDNAIIGAEWSDTMELYNAGSAYVFNFNGSIWTQTQKLTASDAEIGDRFADTVSLSGNRILISASLADGSASRSGKVYVFDFDSTNWIQTQIIVGSNDANNTNFGSEISLFENRVLIGTNRDYAYIFDFDGSTWNESHQFSESDGNLDFNSITSVSLNNNRIAISGYNSNTSEGEVVVYDFDNTNWNQTQKIVSTDAGEKLSFGSSIGLSEENIVIGADFAEDLYNNNSGAVFVFNNTTGVWSENIRYSIAENGSASSYFGYSVSLSANRALVGAYGDNNSGRYSGAAYIYDYDGTSWVETVKLQASDGAEYGYFAYSVSLFDDVALVGAYGSSNLSNFTGAAYVFTFNGSSWSQTQKLLADDGSNSDSFGKSVSLVENRALIGAERNDNDFGRGAAYIFDFDGTSWNQTQKLMGINFNENDGFGSSVSLLGDRVLIADKYNDALGSDSGAAYVYDFDGINWNLTQKLLANDGETADRFGASIHLSNNSIVIGANFDDDNGRSSGSAYVFDFNGSSWTQSQKITPLDGSINYRFGSAVNLSGGTLFVSSRLDSSQSANAGSVYEFTKINNTWNQTQKIIPVDNMEYDFFGSSVGLYNDKVLVGAYGNNDHGNNSGSAYIFQIETIFHDGFEEPNN